MGGLASAATVGASIAIGYLLAPKVVRYVKKRTTSVEVVYFNIPGLGEPIRLLLSYCGIPFKDTRFQERAEFIARKPHLKFGQVPCCIVNGVELFQSYTILRFIAMSFDESGTLYPSSPLLAAECDALMDQIKDMMQGWGPLRYRERFGFPAELFPDEMAAKCQKNYLTEVMPRHLGFFEKQLASSDSPWLLGGSSPSIADFALACQLKGFIGKDFDGVTVAVPPALIKHNESFYALPAVAAFKQTEGK